MLIRFFIELTVLLLVWFGLFWVADIIHDHLALEASSFYGARAQHLKQNISIYMEDHLEQMTHGIRKSNAPRSESLRFKKVPSKNTVTITPTSKRYRLFKKMIPWIDFDRLFSHQSTTQIF